MNISYVTYNVEGGFEEMSTWELEHFASIGIREKVIALIDQMFKSRKRVWNKQVTSMRLLNSYNC